MSARVQEAAFDFQAEMTAFQSAVTRSGAVVSFTGVVRDDTGSLDYMFIEHYPGMTQAALRNFADQATEKFGLEKALVIHRHGRLQPGEAIMMVATAARHRKDAFAGADYLMDYLKSRAPFWKKEVSKGSATWVAAKDQDEAALAAWSLESAAKES
jgi:molybdopterin synthase catalytic subunit